MVRNYVRCDRKQAGELVLYASLEYVAAQEHERLWGEEPRFVHPERRGDGAQEMRLG